MKRLFCIVFLFTLAVAPVFGETKAGMQKKLTKVQKEIAELDKQIKANEAKSSDAAAQLTLTRKKIAAGKELTAELNKEIDATNKQIGEKKKDIERAADRYQMMVDAYEVLIRRAYVNRDTKMWLTYIFAGRDLGQIVRRYNYLHSVSEDMRAQAKDIRDQKAHLEQQMAALDSLKASELELLKIRSDELQTLKADEKSEKAMVDKLKRNKSEYQKQLAKKQKEADALNKAIRDFVQKQASASKGSGKKGSTGKSSPKSQADIKLSAEFAGNKGKLPWPVQGTVVGQFGQHNHPVYTNVKLPFNNGCNIATATGEPVKAVFAGTVKNVAVMPGYNQCVLVQHGDYYTFYCKLRDVRVNTGDKVKVGDILGAVDTISGETQLHFQLWYITDPQDPENWLR